VGKRTGSITCKDAITSDATVVWWLLDGEEGSSCNSCREAFAEDTNTERSGRGGGGTTAHRPQSRTMHGPRQVQ